MSTRRARRIVVHIDRVALRGYLPLEREEIVAGLRDRLAAHFTAEAHALQPDGHREVRTLRGTASTVSGMSAGEALGAGVAESIVGWMRT